jgi:hypothetical protein
MKKDVGLNLFAPPNASNAERVKAMAEALDLGESQIRKLPDELKDKHGDRIIGACFRLGLVPMPAKLKKMLEE